MIKKVIVFGFSFLVTCLMVSCSDEKTIENKEGSTSVLSDSVVTRVLTTLAFKDSIHDFGEFNEGQKVSYTFTYKNTGENPLVLDDVRASCGCTLPEWTKDAIKPGEEGLIKVQYNSDGRPGEFKKTITVIANTPSEVTLLTIQGKVIPKKLDIQGPLKDQAR